MSEVKPELSPLDSDGPELSCPYIDGVIKRYPESKNTLEYVRSINSQLRYDANGYKEIYQSLKSDYDQLKKENEELKEMSKFGWQCYQDRCEGAYIEVSIVKKLNEKLDLAIEALDKISVGSMPGGSYSRRIIAQETLAKLRGENAE